MRALIFASLLVPFLADAKELQCSSTIPEEGYRNDMRQLIVNPVKKTVQLRYTWDKTFTSVPLIKHTNDRAFYFNMAVATNEFNTYWLLLTHEEEWHLNDIGLETVGGVPVFRGGAPHNILFKCQWSSPK